MKISGKSCPILSSDISNFCSINSKYLVPQNHWYPISSLHKQRHPRQSHRYLLDVESSYGWAPSLLLFGASGSICSSPRYSTNVHTEPSARISCFGAWSLNVSRLHQLCVRTIFPAQEAYPSLEKRSLHEFTSHVFLIVLIILRLTRNMVNHKVKHQIIFLT